MNNIINLVKMSYCNLNALRKTLLISITALVIASIISPTFLNMLIGILVYSITYQALAYEDNYGIDYLISYIPVTRKEYVISRYVFSFINIVFSIIALVVSYLISSKYSSNFKDVLDLRTILYSGVATAIILISVLIPCILKFGVIKGRIFITVISISIVFTPTFVISGLVEEGGMDLLMKISEIGIGNITLIGSIFVLIISYIISQRIYQNKQVL